MPAETLARHGAVSRAGRGGDGRGRARGFGADLAVSVTGHRRARRWQRRPSRSASPTSRWRTRQATSVRPPRVDGRSERQQARQRGAALTLALERLAMPSARAAARDATRRGHRRRSARRPGRRAPSRRAAHPRRSGAAGAGASAAALLAHAAGAVVTGCDPGGPSPYTAALEAAGLSASPRHDPAMSDHGTAPIVDRVGGHQGAHLGRCPITPSWSPRARRGVPVEAWQQVIADAAASHGRPPGGGGRHARQVDESAGGWCTCWRPRAATPAPSWGRCCPRRSPGACPPRRGGGAGGVRGGGGRVRRQLRRLPAVGRGAAQRRVGPPGRLRRRGGGPRCVRGLAARRRARRSGRSSPTSATRASRGCWTAAAGLAPGRARACRARVPVSGAGRAGRRGRPGRHERQLDIEGLAGGAAAGAAGAHRAGTTPPTRCAWRQPRPSWASTAPRSPRDWRRSRASGVGWRSRASRAASSCSTTTATIRRPSRPRMAAVRERYPGPAAVGRLRAAHVPPDGGHARRLRRRARDAPTWRSSRTSGPAATLTRRVTSAAALADAISQRAAEPATAPGERRGDRRARWLAACGRVTSCWSWAVGARTSSRERLVERARAAVE